MAGFQREPATCCLWDLLHLWELMETENKEARADAPYKWDQGSAGTTVLRQMNSRQKWSETRRQSRSKIRTNHQERFVNFSGGDLTPEREPVTNQSRDSVRNPGNPMSILFSDCMGERLLTGNGRSQTSASSRATCSGWWPMEAHIMESSVQFPLLQSGAPPESTHIWEKSERRND